MKQGLEETNKILSSMKENYLLANQNLPVGFKSKHWDVFDGEFARFFEKSDIWERMLRNPLTLGLNDNFLEISNQRFSKNKDDLWKQLRRGQISDIIFENRDRKVIEREINHLRRIIAFTDLKFVIKNCITDAGSPVTTKIKIEHEGQSHIVNYNKHDMGDLYHSWLILQQIGEFKNYNPIICEIGGGYGGLASKIKSNVKGAKIVMLDLPEVNAYQTFYLSRVFDGAIIKGYKDLSEEGMNVFANKFDFLILPGWTINQLPSAYVDSYINVRSMMEMSKDNLEFYFKSIQTSLKIEGTFSCFNRYIKPVGNFENRFNLYPFDDDWKILMSQPSALQPHIHQLIVKRLNNNSGAAFRQELKKMELI